MKKTFCVSVIFAFVSTVVQSQNFSFKHMDMLDGLSNNQVNDICRDDDGFVWVSTAWGLNRYDGYTFRHVLHTSDDSLSLADNYVDYVRCLHDGKLLVKSSVGFQTYDTRADAFVSTVTFADIFGSNANVTASFVDRSRRVWVASGSKVTCYVSDAEELLKFDLSATVAGKCGDVVAISQGSREMVFVCNDGSIALLDNGLDLSSVRVESTPMSGGARSIFVDNRDNYWIWSGEKYGLWFYNARERKWTLCNGEESSLFTIPDKPIRSVVQDQMGRIWVATDHGGVAVLNLQTYSSTVLCAEKDDVRSLVSNSVNTLYCDVEGSVWLGYYKSGISLYNEAIYKFATDRLDVSDIDSEFVSDITVIEEDREGNLWYGTNGSGLLCVEKKTGNKKIYKHSVSDPNSLSSNVIVSLLAASDGTLWVGTFQGGLCRFDGRSFKRYMSDSGVTQAMAHENIWDLCEDAQKNIWIGSLGRGVASYNLVTGEQNQYDAAGGKLSSDAVSALTTSRDGRVYVGTSTGVVVLNPATNSTRRVTPDVGDALSENVNDIVEDTRGLLWVGMRDGLLVVDMKTNNTWTLTTENNLINNVVVGIVEDNNKNMWVATASGVSNVVVGSNPRNDDYTFSIFNYSAQDGLNATAFNIKSIKRTSYGEILLGSYHGVNRFTTEHIRYNQNSPRVHFVSLDVFDKEVGIGEEIDGRVILTSSLSQTEEVTLGYSQNMFTVNFSTLSYILPEKTQYTYLLEGFTDKWLTTSDPKVSYTNLTPGDYRLLVRAANSDGFWSDMTSELGITVLAPWWMSTTAYLVYILVFALIIVLVFRQLKARERNRYQLQEIETEMKRKQELDDMKLRFFTNVSHELRTPLSLIISPLENLIEENKDQPIGEKLTVIHKNAKRLLQLVNQLLDFRKADVGSMQLNLYEGDIVAFVCETADAFKSLADRDMHFEVEKAVDEINMEFDRDKIGKVVSNILSNAFKYTPEGGKIELWIGRSSDGKSVLIMVSDTGLGIPDEYKEKVFDRFFQVPRSENVYAGSGIGLHLAKEFVELHGGTISAGDNVGHGTVMTVSLPIVSMENENEAEGNEVDEEETEEEEEVDIRNGRKMLLIVDDNADFRKLLVDTLSNEYDVKQARNGQEAFEAILKDMPDLIISDVMMPVMDGNQLCNKVKNDVRTSHIPFIMLTAKTAEEYKIEGLVLGADDYLTKPFNPQILRLRVAKLIDLSRQRHEKFRTQIEPEPSEITITPLDEQLIQKAIKCCEDNMADSDFSVEVLSRNLGMSRVHLYKKLLAITGRSPIEFIRVIRLKRAAQLLRDKAKNVADVAYDVGFNNPKSFSRYFKEEFGVLPSVYQSENASDIRTDVSAKKS